MNRVLICILPAFLIFLWSFSSTRKLPVKSESPFITILGIAQDAGYPQAGCKKDCCKRAWNNASLKRLITSIALTDPETNQRWIFDCSPDFPEQLHFLDSISPAPSNEITGIFLTHAHTGHYTGLIHLGREAMGAKAVKVWAMPLMKEFLTNNGPWSQLVKLRNIELMNLKKDSTVKLSAGISVTPFIVPHRDEYSETVGYRITTARHSLVFIPDIDKWSKWTTSITELVKQNDFLLLDGTFYQEGEIAGRNMAEVPHPFIRESMELFKDLSQSDKKKVCFIHFNHTNPVLDEKGEAQKEIKKNGFTTAYQGQRIEL